MRCRRPAAVLFVAALVLTSARPAGAAEGEAAWRLGPAPPAHPARVVTLAPNLTETVLDLGAGARLVGVSRYDDDAQVKALPRVGGYLDPNLEAILALRPDLVIVQPSPGNKETVEKLASLGVPIRVVAARTLPEIRAMIRAVARDLGVPKRGAALSAALKARLDRVRAAAKGLPRPRTLLVYGHEPLVVAAPGTFGDELLAVAGGTNVVPPSGVGYPTLPLEEVVARDPEVILDLVIHGDGAPRPAPFERLTSVSAVAHHRVVRLKSERLMRPGPRLGEAVYELFRVLHPEAARRLGDAAP